MNKSDENRIAWIGIGNLGRPMVGRLIAAGIRPLLYDTSPDALARFAGQADIAESAAAAAAGADLVFSTIPTDAVLKLVAAEVVNSLPPGAVYCDMSTVSPQASADVASLFEGTAAGFLRATVSGTVVHAETGVLTVIASGPDAAYQRCLPVFEHFSAHCFHVGAAEEARHLKLLINNLVGSTIALLAESLATGSKAGLDWAVMLDVIGASAIASPLLKFKLDALKNRDYSPAFTADLMIKDIDLFTQTANGLGCPAPLAGQTLALLRELAEAGGGAQDYLGLVRLLETKAGLEGRD